MIKLFAVYDVKGCAYGTPMFVVTRGIAVRGFADAVAKPETGLNQHPGDYSLYELGEYDPNSGRITSLDQPLFLHSASEFVEPKISRPVSRPSDVVDALNLKEVA